VAGLKRWIRDLDLWCSSCMIARDDAGELIGVLLGCKRPAETLLLAVGVHPGHLRRGHGRHLVTSLSSKLAILGPPRLVAEVPADDARACAFFESCGYVAEARLRDFTLTPAAVAPRLAPELVAAVTADELIAAGALAQGAPRPWSRAVPAVAKRADVQGLAIASPDRMESWILWRDLDAGEREVQAFGWAPGAEAAAAALLAHLAALGSEPLILARVHAHEVDAAVLERLGFAPGREHVRYATTATPA
jgi:hypothetical protein